MSDYLVIVESPKKAKKIQEYLGKDYLVIASFGHVFDLPPKKLGIDLKKDFATTYVVMDDKKDVKNNISVQSKKAKIIYLMTDLDREGAGIAANIYNGLLKTYKVKRATTNAITKSSILDAIKNAYDLDDEADLVEAYEARRVLDRLVGFKCSYITKQATGGRSAGRCQSVALRIIADREKEIQIFVPVVYWPITAELLTQDTKEKVVADIKFPKPLDISTKEEAEKIIKVIKAGPVKVSKFEQNKVQVNPYAPFQTSTLYQASASLGISLDKCKKAAQSLFDDGKITYHRTDSLYIEPTEMSNIRHFISSNYDKKYQTSSARVYKKKVKNAQEAHEAIRPTSISLQSAGGTADEKKIYELIWRRTVASQMASAEVQRSSAEFSCGKYLLAATGSKELFDGFRKVWTYSDVNDRYMPTMKVSDTVDVIDISTKRMETQPPKRYSEMSLVKTLEKEGIGRPSTYAAIVKTILDRGYVEKTKNIFNATELGIGVSDFLVASDFCFVDIGFTCAMEDDLDDITNKKAKKIDVLSKFWCRLKQDLQKAKDVKNEKSKTDYKCPLCKKNGTEAFLLKKHSQYGEFYSCENYKKDGGCTYTAQVGDDGKPKEKIKKDPPKKLGFKCDQCGSDMVVRTGPYGEFQGCSSWPKCKTVMDMDGNIKKKSKKKWSKKKK